MAAEWRSCVTFNCPRRGALLPSSICPACGAATHLAVSAVVTPPPAVRQSIGAGEVISRVVFGGFWTLVTIGAFIGGLVALSQGSAGGLLAILVAALTGLYAGYIFRGGRFRIMFW
jgi:hypothetical protein